MEHTSITKPPLGAKSNGPIYDWQAMITQTHRHWQKVEEIDLEDLAGNHFGFLFWTQDQNSRFAAGFSCDWEEYCAIAAISS
tara:strand:- start:1898 stop:2143 length:246 start_codon:yes stop_codon:yes gene_type:complete